LKRKASIIASTAVATRTSRRVKAEDETGDRRAEGGKEEPRIARMAANGEGAVARGFGSAKVGADRRDARDAVESKDGCGEPSLPWVDGRRDACPTGNSLRLCVSAGEYSREFA